MKSGNSDSVSRAALQALYDVRFKGRFAYRDAVWRVLTGRFFQTFVRETDTVLDLGAGYGEFINHISCEKKYAMDLNPSTPQSVEGDVTVLAQDSATAWSLPGNSLDVIFSSNFFEHLETKNALALTLQEAARCLRPGGQLISMGPNIRYVHGAYWDYIDHHLPLTERSLSEALEQAGLHVKQSTAQFLPFTMASGPHYPTVLVSLYLRMPLLWRIFGRQFLVIAEKPSL